MINKIVKKSVRLNSYSCIALRKKEILLRARLSRATHIFYMLLVLLLIVPITGIFLISTTMPGTEHDTPSSRVSASLRIRQTGLVVSIVNLFISFIVFIFFNFSSNQFQFVQEYHSISSFDFYLGVDGISIYFVLLTTIIMPIAILSN